DLMTVLARSRYGRVTIEIVEHLTRRRRGEIFASEDLHRPCGARTLPGERGPCAHHGENASRRDPRSRILRGARILLQCPLHAPARRLVAGEREDRGVQALHDELTPSSGVTLRM